MDRNRRIRKRLLTMALLRKRKASLSLASNEAPDVAQPGSRELIKQAERDVSQGLRDTDLHGIPSDVPGPGPAPENSPGASLPPGGVDAPDRKT